MARRARAVSSLVAALRAQAARYLQGWLRELPRQSLESMGLALAGPPPQAVRTSPLFMRDGPWQEELRLPRHWPEVDQAWGAGDGVLLLEGSGLLHQGPASAGVKRPSCHAGGKRANGQAGLFGGSARRPRDPADEQGGEPGALGRRRCRMARHRGAGGLARA
jgi:hypothetical protein